MCIRDRSIGGRDAVELFELFLSRQSGETEAFRAGSVEYALPVHLWLEGLRPPFALLRRPRRLRGLRRAGLHGPRCAATARAGHRPAPQRRRRLAPGRRAAAVPVRPAVAAERAQGMEDE